MTLRVAHVTNTVDRVGGLKRYVVELSARLARRGVAVTIIAKRADPGPRTTETLSDGSEVVRTWVPSKRSPFFAPAYAAGIPYVSARELRRLPPGTIVHGHFFAPMLGAALIGTDYVFTCHGPVYQELLDEHEGSYLLPGPVQRLAVGGVRAAERLVLDRARRVSVLSDFMRDQLTVLGASPPAVTVLPGGVDTERFSPGRAVRDDWAAPAAPLLLTARRLATGKGVPELVEAMPAVLERLPAARLAIAGNGPERSRIEARIVALGLSERVRLLGELDTGRLVEWIRAADLCVVPTQRPEPFGLSTVEALACGAPVLGTPGGASPDLLAGLDPRLVAGSVRSEALAAAIVGLAEDADRLRSVRARARAHVHPRFGWDAVADAWLEIYREREAQPRAA